MKQLTGRDNYKAFTDYSKRTWGDPADFEDKPELIASDIKLAVRSALFFWDDNKLYTIADGGYSQTQADGITFIVNKHTDSYEKRYNNLILFLDKRIFSDVF